MEIFVQVSFKQQLDVYYTNGLKEWFLMPDGKVMSYEESYSVQFISH